MKFDLKSQILARRLADIYEHKDEYNGITTQYCVIRSDYSPLYDYMISDGHTIDFDAETKKTLYNFAKKAFKREHSDWIPNTLNRPKEEHEAWLKKELEKYYKSFLVKKYLLDRYKETGEMLKLHYEDGTEVKLIEITLKHGED